MDATEALTRLGGVGSTADLLALTTRRSLRTALDAGRVERVTRSRYAVAGAQAQHRAAARMAGTLSTLSAARHHGREVKDLPGRAWVTVPRKPW